MNETTCLECKWFGEYDEGEHIFNVNSQDTCLAIPFVKSEDGKSEIITEVWSDNLSCEKYEPRGWDFDYEGKED